MMMPLAAWRLTDQAQTRRIKIHLPFGGLHAGDDRHHAGEQHDEYRQDFVKHADVLFFSSVNIEDPTIVASQYLQENPKLIIIVGMGSEGAMLITSDQMIKMPAVESEKPIIDTNGAGDSLAVGFHHIIKRGK